MSEAAPVGAASANAAPVRTHRDGALLVVTIDHPPVNALSQAVRAALVAALDAAAADDSVGAVVLQAEGTTFIGGADIREFGGPRLTPGLGEVCTRFEQCTKPVVVAMQGAALGGGLEVALGAHYRVASPAVEIGFPEVLLGLLPGAGGTQRAPRLAGAAIALDLMLSGRRMTAQDACACGLIDRIADDPRHAALVWARELAGHDLAREELAELERVGRPAGPRRARDGVALADSTLAMREIAAARAAVDTKYPGLFSPARIIDAVQAAVTLPFDEGLALESSLFQECLASPQRQALIHLFFSEREVRKLPDREALLAVVADRLRAVYRRAGVSMVSAGVNAIALNAALRAFGMAEGPVEIAPHRQDVGAPVHPDAPTGTTAHPPGIDEAVGVCIAAMIMEGTRLLQDGVVPHSRVIDVAAVQRVGFPRYRGGPLKYADETGLAGNG